MRGIKLPKAILTFAYIREVVFKFYFLPWKSDQYRIFIISTREYRSNDRYYGKIQLLCNIKKDRDQEQDLTGRWSKSVTIKTVNANFHNFG